MDYNKKVKLIGRKEYFTKLYKINLLSLLRFQRIYHICFFIKSQLKGNHFDQREKVSFRFFLKNTIELNELRIHVYLINAIKMLFDCY